MSETGVASPDPEESILVEFHKALDDGRPGEEVVREFSARYPRLAGRFRAQTALGRALDRALGEVEEEEDQTPDRLGDFRILRRLDGGGMGAIYEAVQEPLGRRVAVKTIRGARHRLTDRARARFLREQRVLARLHHTHIVPIHAAGQDGDLQYFAMPYIEGASLSRVIRAALRRTSTPGSGETPALAELAEEARAESGGDRDPSGRSTRPGAGDPPPPSPPATRPMPAARYFRSVALALRDAAEAVQHAHDAGVIHRDLKPANLMIDRREHCWVMDFGLARHERDVDGARGLPDPGSAVAGPLTDGGAVLGTYPYMAPEQFDGQADARSDVWGLGVTLCELLTLRRAFDGPTPRAICEQVRSGFEPPSRGMIGPIPTDLARICRKAMQVDPSRRYTTAREFGADLDRWLRGEPTEAHPARPPRRAWLWSRRNPGWASAIGAVGLVLVLLATMFRARADAFEREALAEQLQRLLLTPHDVGWSAEAWGLLSRIAEGRPDPATQPLATASLAGLDAATSKRFEEFGARMPAFDPEGRRLLLGGVTAAGDHRRSLDARLWDVEADELVALIGSGPGPVAFRADGTPVQLTLLPGDFEARDAADGPWSVVLRDLASGADLGRFPLPDRRPPRFAILREMPPLALQADGSLAAVAAAWEDGPTKVFVWNAGSGRPLHVLDAEATALAFSGDGSLLACGEASGRITLWSLATGRKLTALHNGRTRVHCLAFHRDPAGGGDPDQPRGWVLAAGAAGGTATIWDLGTGLLRARCRGGHHDAFALAFSPDGTLLATTGRTYAKLWDAATGRLVLRLRAGNYAYGLAFSPDGRRLVVGSTEAHGEPGQVRIWDLHEGRGIRSLRGLTGQVQKVVVSPDGRRVAALSQDWQVAIWGLPSGTLLRRLDVPPGTYADNAALAFDAKGGRFAFAAGREARLWDVATGDPLGSWPLPEGLQDTLAFHGADRLLSIRVETRDGRFGPLSNAPAEDHPRVCRVRDLLGETPEDPIAEVADFDRYVFAIRAAPDGSSFVIDGLGRAEGGQGRRVRAYAGPTAEPLWSVRSQRDRPDALVGYDPTGRSLYLVTSDDHSSVVLLEMPTGRYLGEIRTPQVFVSLGPDARRWVGGVEEAGGHGLYGRGRRGPLLRMENDLLWNAHVTVGFGTDGRQMLGTTDQGIVTLWDLTEIQSRLTEIGLGW